MIEFRRRYSGSKGSGSPSFSRLPAGYQEVEYIQNTGDSYVVLPFKFANIKFRFCVTPNDTISSMQMGYGSVSMIGFVKNSGVDAIIPIVNGKDTSIRIPTSKTIIHTIEIRHSDNKIIIDGIASPSTEIFSNTTGFGVFVRPEFTAEKMRGKMYVIQRDNGEGYIDQYIPCRRLSDNEKGMYDIVNDVFYTNAGTGEFSVGQDVHYNIPPEYQQVEYLESTGNQYLKIPVSIIGTDKLIFEWAFTQLRSDGFVLGSNQPSRLLEIYTYSNMWDGIFYTKLKEPPYAEQKYKLFLHENNVILHREQYLIQEFVASVFYPYNGHIVLNQCYRSNSINSSYYGLARYYNFEIEGKMHLIPCYRKSDNEAGMYDLVSGEFYTNAGTGTFDVGPDVIG